MKRENHATIVEKQHDKEVAEINLDLAKIAVETDQITQIKNAEQEQILKLVSA